MRGISSKILKNTLPKQMKKRMHYIKINALLNTMENKVDIILYLKSK